ncbi:MAG: DNA repair protein [Pseudozobellia sp.]|nr:DNA repair protein [Pseudozobellia sp.]|tara:strand:- start:246 stop:719 length:474 start_codon:yes stop_codon:yes gene_type:complete
MKKRIPNKISEIKLTYTRKVKASERPKVTCSNDAYTLFRENWNDLTINLFEEFKVLLLDRNNQCMGLIPISQGGVSGTVADAKLIFSSALKARACGLILGHNHPSSNTKPSTADINLTNNLVKGGTYIGIQVLDHIIVTDDGYTSLADEGYIKSPNI